MTPTEILAIQHYEWTKNILSKLDCNVDLLIGKIKGNPEKMLNNLISGNINIIGTHALF